MWCFIMCPSHSQMLSWHLFGVPWSAEIMFYDLHTSRFHNPWKLLFFPGFTSLSAAMLISSPIITGKMDSIFLPITKPNPNWCTNDKTAGLGQVSCPLKQKRALSAPQSWKRPLYLRNFLTDYKWQVKQSPKRGSISQVTMQNLKFSKWREVFTKLINNKILCDFFPREAKI